MGGTASGGHIGRRGRSRISCRPTGVSSRAPSRPEPASCTHSSGPDRVSDLTPPSSPSPSFTYVGDRERREGRGREPVRHGSGPVSVPRGCASSSVSSWQSTYDGARFPVSTNRSADDKRLCLTPASLTPFLSVDSGTPGTDPLRRWGGGMGQWLGRHARPAQRPLHVVQQVPVVWPPVREVQDTTQRQDPLHPCPSSSSRCRRTLLSGPDSVPTPQPIPTMSVFSGQTP